MEGYMNPLILHTFHLHKDKQLSSHYPQMVLKRKWPLIFSRLGSATNIIRAIDHELVDIIRAYGVDNHGFANVTLLVDEYQMFTKEGTRVQGVLHESLENNQTFFDVVAEAIAEDSSEAALQQAEFDLQTRFSTWESEAPDERTGVRMSRSAFSAVIKGHVRISATTVSGQLQAESWNMRKSFPIELAVESTYYGHETSKGIDPSKIIHKEWRGSSNLDFLEPGDFPTLEVPDRLQKFVVDEVRAELARPGYAHVLLQVFGGNNGSLFNMCKFFADYANQEVAEAPVICVTSYSHTTAMPYPGGPWIICSHTAIPLLQHIADVAQDLFVTKPKAGKYANIPHGKIALSHGGDIANGIRHNRQPLANALQMPKQIQHLKYVLALVDGAIEREAWDKSRIKLVTIGAGMLKVGMTPKTYDHKMGVTVALMSATERIIKNLSGEDVSQGVLGRISGARDGCDPYWDARGDVGAPPKAIISGSLMDQLSTAKHMQMYTMQAAKKRIQQGGGGSLIEAMANLDFEGFEDLSLQYSHFKGTTPKRAREGGDVVNSRAVRAAKLNSTGTGKTNLSVLMGFLDQQQTAERIEKFNQLKDEHPELFTTTRPPHAMPMYGTRIYKKWSPSFPHYLATVLDIELVSENTDDLRIKYQIRYDTDDKHNPCPHDPDKYVQWVYLDEDMNEWHGTADTSAES
jgi:hypothetical protein